MMILVGVDFDEGSRAAIAHARALSAVSGLPVESLHVREYGAHGEWKPAPPVRAWLDKVGLPVSEVRTRNGVPWVELVKFARERKAMLIVAGRCGRSGPQTSFLGSTALRLATHAPDPVLLVTGGHEIRSGTRVGSDESLTRPPDGISENPGGATRSAAS